MKILLTALILLVQLAATSQIDPANIKRHGVYVETYALRHDFSNGFVSVNYEFAAFKKRANVFRMGIYPDFRTTVSIPVTWSWISTMRAAHHFEIGAGLVVRLEHYDSPDMPGGKRWYRDIPAAMLPIMYRYQKEKGLMVRAGFNLWYSWPVLLSPSLAIGWRF
jgi:hypothetical protein